MTRDAAVVVAVVALAIGWVAHKLRVANADAAGAKVKAQAASRVAWRVRGAAVVVGLAVFAVVHTWLYSGRR